jgi:hypothetical protein
MAFVVICTISVVIPSLSVAVFRKLFNLNDSPLLPARMAARMGEAIAVRFGHRRCRAVTWDAIHPQDSDTWLTRHEVSRSLFTYGAQATRSGRTAGERGVVGSPAHGHPC